MTETATAPPVGLTYSADSHIVEPHETYLPRIDPKFRDRAPKMITLPDWGATMIADEGTEHQIRCPAASVSGSGRRPDQLGYNDGKGWDAVHPGAYDPKARLIEQDKDSVVAEVLYPSFGMLLCNHPDADYKRACFAAYNEWMAEFSAYAPERLIGLGQTACITPAETIGDLEKIKDLGLRGVMFAGVPHHEDYDHHDWDPVWRASIELGLPISFHILTGGAGAMMSNAYRGPKVNSFLGIIRGNQDIIGTLIFGGVFERNPDLRVVCVEADAGWAPHYMYRADHAYKRHRNWILPGITFSKLPSEYFKEHVYLTFQDDWTAFKQLDSLREDRLMWANDHPHADSTWPWSQEILAEQTTALTQHQRDRILRDNMRELYGLS